MLSDLLCCRKVKAHVHCNNGTNEQHRRTSKLSGKWVSSSCGLLNLLKKKITEKLVSLMNWHLLHVPIACLLMFDDRQLVKVIALKKYILFIDMRRDFQAQTQFTCGVPVSWYANCQCHFCPSWQLWNIDNYLPKAEICSFIDLPLNKQ